MNQGAKLPIVVFLTGSIPKGQFDVLSIYFDICYIVLEDSGNIDLEMKRVEVNKQRRFANKSDE